MKKQFKEILSAVLSSALLLISGCGGSSDTPGASDASEPFSEISAISEDVRTEEATEAQTASPTAETTQAHISASEIPTTAEEYTQTKAPSQTQRDRIDELLSQMSLEERIGQVILAGYSDNAAQSAPKYHFGGYTLYAKDFEGETEESIKQKLAAIGSASLIPPFIAADEEGGEVIRISRYSQFSDTPLPALSAAAAGDIDAFGERTADILKKAGVNLNLAPVADVAKSKADYIYGRTCQLGYEETGEAIAKLVAALKRNEIMSCLKHFPGYGSNVDTHTGIAVDERSREEFEAKDFIPFKAGINAGAPMVMVNHNIVTAYNDSVPASLAPEIHSALRRLDFNGIIVTDDLGMQAILSYTDDPYADAFLAGNDLLCTGDGAACFDSLYKAVSDGRITENRLNESVCRILSAKLEYGIID